MNKKTPEELAKEYALKTHLGGWEVAASDYGFLAGYHSRDEEVAKLKEEIAMWKAELKEVGSE
jgi:hypothetical protein